MRDDVGLIFVGVALLCLIAILYGHRRRENFTTESNVWEAIQREVEADLQTFLVFDVGTFRANTNDQTKFFAMIDGQLSNSQQAEADASNNDTSWDFIRGETKTVSQFVTSFEQVGINLKSPSQYEDPSGKGGEYFTGKFDLDKPFDTRIALLDAQYANTLANNKKGISDGQGDSMKSLFMSTIPLRYIIPGAKSAMYSAAKAYMSSPLIGLQNTKAVIKTGESVVSTIFGS